MIAKLTVENITCTRVYKRMEEQLATESYDQLNQKWFLCFKFKNADFKGFIKEISNQFI